MGDNKWDKVIDGLIEDYQNEQDIQSVVVNPDIPEEDKDELVQAIADNKPLTKKGNNNMAKKDENKPKGPVPEGIKKWQDEHRDSKGKVIMPPRRPLEERIAELKAKREGLQKTIATIDAKIAALDKQMNKEERAELLGAFDGIETEKLKALVTKLASANWL